MEQMLNHKEKTKHCKASQTKIINTETPFIYVVAS
jgi:hypothetical protein